MASIDADLGGVAPPSALSIFRKACRSPSLGSSLLTVSYILVLLPTTSFLSHQMGAEDYGKWVVATTIMGMGLIACSFGFPELAIRKISGAEDVGERRAFMRQLDKMTLIPILLCLIAMSIWPRVSGVGLHDSFQMDMVWAQTGLAAYLSLRVAYLRGIARGALGQSIATFGPFLNLGLLFALSAAGVGSRYLPYIASPMAVAVSLLISLVAIRRLDPAKDCGPSAEVPGLSQIFLMSLPFATITAVTLLNQQVDIMLIAWYLGPEEAGAYQIALQVCLVAYLIRNQIGMNYSGVIGSLATVGDIEGIARISRKTARFTAAIVAAFFLVDLLFGRSLFPMAFGPQAHLAYPVSLIVMSAWLFACLMGIPTWCLLMSDHKRDVLHGGVGSLCVNVIGGLIMIPSFGAIGAAVTLLFSVIWYYGYLAWRCYRVMGVNITIFGR